MDEALGRRLDAIEKRLAALEARANGLNPTPAPPVTPAPPQTPPLVSPTPAAVRPGPQWDQPGRTAAGVGEALVSTDASHSPPFASQTSAPPAGVRPPPLPPKLSAEELAARERYASNMRAAYDGVPPELGEAREPIPAQPAFARVTRPASSGFELEQLLGLKFAGWIGAIVLLIGAALGVKFAYDQGWLGNLPGAVRCGVIAVCGLALIGAGEVVYRRINNLSSAGPFGAGVGLLFLSAYAGQAWYALYTPGIAFMLMAVAALAGMAIAARADLVSIAALALIGGGIVAPACFTFHGPLAGFLAYVLSLQILAIGLCAWRATPKWWVLRGLALGVTFTWLIDRPAALLHSFDSWASLITAAVVVTLFQGELLWTTRRHVRSGWGEPTRGVVFSLLATLAFAAELMSSLRHLPATTRGDVLIALVPLAFVLARLCGRLNLRALSRGFDVQAVLLLMIAIPVRLNGPSVLISWIAVAGGLAMLAVLNRNRTAAVLAAVVWAFSAVAVAVWTSDQNSSRNIWLTLGAQPLVAGVIVAGIAAVVGHAVAQGLRRTFGRGDIRAALNAVDVPILVDLAAALCFMAVLLPHVEVDFGTRVGLGYALLLWLTAAGSPFAALAAVSTALLIFVGAKWAMFDVIGRHARGIYPGPWPILNAQTLHGLAIAALIAVQAKSRRYQLAGADGFLALTLLAILLIAGSAEVDRYAVLQHNGPVWIVRQVGLSIYWAGLAVAALVVGFASHQHVLRLAALGLLGITLLKVVVVDLSGAGTGWRILSFLFLGALLLITSVLYGRFAKKTSTPTSAAV